MNNLVIFEDEIKYDGWVTAILAFPVVLLIVLGIVFSMAPNHSHIFHSVSEEEAKLASLILFASTAFVLLVYLLFLPRRIFILQEGIRIKFGGFGWTIAFATIKSLRAAKGIFVCYGYSCITSYGRQIEIVRNNDWNVRVCPKERERFLDQANRALSDWRKAHGS